jgi:nifR3 family TIM-barrel protein
MLKIGNIKLENNLVLAPMLGVNCAAYRMLCKNHGAGLVTTQMYHPESLFTRREIVDIIKEEKPISAQIVGKDPEKMGEGARILSEKADIIDINLGCPDQKVLAAKAGAFLIKHPEQFVKMVSKVVNSVNCPVTAKIRSGWDEKSINAVEASKMLEDLGVAAITIHARTRKQVYTGKADWNVIKAVKEKVNIPVIGNGDVFSPQDYKAMIEKTNADFVMIGRGAMGNPLIFENCLRFIEGKPLIKKDTRMAEKLFNEFLGYYNKYAPKFTFSEIRQHAMWLAKGLQNGAALRNKIGVCHSVEEIEGVWKKF